MEFLALIPARYSSSRFPGKPLAPIGGKPMVQHVYERAAAVFSRCYVATDDERIAETVKGFGGHAVMTGHHHRSGTDRCAEALHIIEGLTGRNFDVVVNIQGDEPFINADYLKAVRALFDDPGTEIGTLVSNFGPREDIGDPDIPKVVFGKDGTALYFSRSIIPYVRDKEMFALRDTIYYKHIGLYGYRRETLLRIAGMAAGGLEKAESLEQLRWLENGLRIRVAKVAGDTLSVDTAEDLQRAEEYCSLISGQVSG